jgi:hypothetical protein
MPDFFGRSMATIRELRAIAKSRKIKKYYSMNKSQLLQALGMRDESPRKAGLDRLKRAIANGLRQLPPDATPEEKRVAAGLVKDGLPPHRLPRIIAAMRISTDPQRPSWERISDRSNPETWHNTATRARFERKIAGLGREAIAAAEQNLGRILANTEIFIRIKPNDLTGIVRSGRYKTAFETGETRGVNDIDRRAKTERDGIGYPPNTPPRKRPVYGYMASSAEGDPSALPDYPGFDPIDALDYYGHIALHLKAKAKKRATFTGGDTYEGFSSSPITAPRASSMVKPKDSDRQAQERVQQVAQARNTAELIKVNQQAYIEAQVHGGLKSSDIAAIFFLNGEKPNQAVKRWAAKNGIKITEV